MRIKNQKQKNFNLLTKTIKERKQRRKEKQKNIRRKTNKIIVYGG